MASKYPEIKVKLIGESGSAFAILGSVKRALQAGGVPKEEVAAFYKEATSGDYYHLLNVCNEWVTIL